MNRISRISLCLTFVLSVFASCVSLQPAAVDVKQGISNYSRVYIPQTQPVNSTTAVVISKTVLPSSQTVNPRDVIAGRLSKRKYIILDRLDERFQNETIIVNYGESNRRSLGLGEYTIEVTLQFVSAATGELLGTTTAEGYGETEAESVKQAVTRALDALFKHVQE